MQIATRSIIPQVHGPLISHVFSRGDHTANIAGGEGITHSRRPAKVSPVACVFVTGSSLFNATSINSGSPIDFGKAVSSGEENVFSTSRPKSDVNPRISFRTGGGFICI